MLLETPSTAVTLQATWALANLALHPPARRQLSELDSVPRMLALTAPDLDSRLVRQARV